MVNRPVVVLARALSRLLFAAALALGAAGAHRYVFGPYPKLWPFRLLPWDRVEYVPLFAAALGAAALAAWLGRAARRSDEDRMRLEAPDRVDALPAGSAHAEQLRGVDRAWSANARGP